MNTPVEVKSEVKLEQFSPLQKVLKKCVIYPFLNTIFPKSWIINFSKNSDSAFLKELSRGPGSWRSMMLSYDREVHKSFLDQWIYHTGGLPVALRNRKRLVVQFLKELIEEHLDEGEVDIVSVGCGTGIHTIEGMARVTSEKVRAHLFDLDSEAFEVGEEIKHKHGLSHRVVFIKADVSTLPDHLSVKPQVVEMVGIIEYLSDEQMINLFERVNHLTALNSSILVNSIQPAHGMDKFLKRVFDFHLRYRSPENMMKLLEKCGYDNFEIANEPTGVYSVITGKKVREVGNGKVSE